MSTEFPHESFKQNAIKHKTGLLNLAGELGNISKACRIIGFSRDTFYRYQTARDAGGVEALCEVSRKKPNLGNRMEEATELAVMHFATAFPAHGQVRAGNELRKRDVFVSPSGGRSIWMRYVLASMKQRLAALEKKSAEEGLVLTKAQVQALECKSMMRFVAKSKASISLTSAARIAFTSAPSKEWVAFISKLLWLFKQPSSTPLEPHAGISAGMLPRSGMLFFVFAVFNAPDFCASRQHFNLEAATVKHFVGLVLGRNVLIAVSVRGIWGHFLGMWE